MPASRSGITSCSRYARGSASSVATSASETGTGDSGRQWRASWTSIRTPYSPFVLKEMAPEAWNVRTLRVWSSRCWSGSRPGRSWSGRGCLGVGAAAYDRVGAIPTFSDGNGKPVPAGASTRGPWARVAGEAGPTLPSRDLDRDPPTEEHATGAHEEGGHGRG